MVFYFILIITHFVNKTFFPAIPWYMVWLGPVPSVKTYYQSAFLVLCAVHRSLAHQLVEIGVPYYDRR